MAMRAKKSKKAVEAAEVYHDGRSRNAYQLRRNIKKLVYVLSVELMKLSVQVPPSSSFYF